MCGITGVFSFNNQLSSNWNRVEDATWQLRKRGPNNTGVKNFDGTVLGHTRLSVIDLSENANQPMTNNTDRYHIVFNGEIYNHKTLRKDLEKQGCTFQTQSDSEVLLYAFITWGKDCLEKLEGCFAFAIYDKEQHQLFIARDRFGIKPLYWYKDEHQFVFASELKAMLEYPIQRKLNEEATQLFFELNYIPAPLSIIENVHKLMPGQFAIVNEKQCSLHTYYNIPKGEKAHADFESNKKQVRAILEEAVQKRMVADVQVGTFLSGGIDSTIISLLAKEKDKNLMTFSIGYKDNPFFDESDYAQEMAKHIGTNHHAFMLGNDDFLQHFEDIMNAMDEPFADSSAVPVYILSKETAKQATVILSGDGADEIFGGYNKHKALLKSQEKSLTNFVLKLGSPVLQSFQGSRNSPLGNKFRQAKRYADGLGNDALERYWKWASISSQKEVEALLNNALKNNSVKNELSKLLTKKADLNAFLRADMSLILPNDMLTKVDMMSMANSLEVRVPFLDKKTVEYGFSLPTEMKIHEGQTKRILREAFKSDLPDSFFTRKKQGFEIPLESWFQNELKSQLMVQLNLGKIQDQGFLNTHIVKNWVAAVINPRANNLGHINDAPAKLWALLCFQKFVDTYLN